MYNVKVILFGILLAMFYQAEAQPRHTLQQKNSCFLDYYDLIDNSFNLGDPMLGITLNSKSDSALSITNGKVINIFKTETKVFNITVRSFDKAVFVYRNISKCFVSLDSTIQSGQPLGTVFSRKQSRPCGIFIKKNDKYLNEAKALIFLKSLCGNK